MVLDVTGYDIRIYLSGIEDQPATPGDDGFCSESAWMEAKAT
jgi:hypothetical protein